MFFLRMLQFKYTNKVYKLTKNCNIDKQNMPFFKFKMKFLIKMCQLKQYYFYKYKIKIFFQYKSQNDRKIQMTLQEI